MPPLTDKYINNENAKSTAVLTNPLIRLAINIVPNNAREREKKLNPRSLICGNKYSAVPAIIKTFIM